MLTSEKNESLADRRASRDESDEEEALRAASGFGLPTGGPLGLGMEFHHIGVAVKSISRALEYYIGAFGFRKATEVLDVPSEKVRVCFIASPSGVLIELVEGVGDDSPVAEILKQPGAGPYHLCYSVPDLDIAIEKLRQNRCFLLKRFERPAYGHNRFAFC